MIIKRKSVMQRLNNMHQKFSDAFDLFEERNRLVLLKGPVGCGKTTFAKQFAERTGGFYFSLKNYTSKMALKFLSEAVSEAIGETVIAESWEDCVTLLKKIRKQFNYTFVFDDADLMFNDEEFRLAFEQITVRGFPARLFIVLVVEQNYFENVVTDYHSEHKYREPIVYMHLELKYLSIAEICKLFPKLRADKQLDIFTLTGGIPKLVAEFAERNINEESFSDFIFSDSYKSFAEEVFSRLHEKPESFMMLCCAVADNCNRIGQIAKFSGYQLNKCDKYMNTLIKDGIIEKKQDTDGKNSFHFANSYYYFWFRCVYSNCRLAEEEIKKALQLAGAYEYHKACVNYTIMQLFRKVLVFDKKEMNRCIRNKEIGGTVYDLYYKTKELTCTARVFDDIYYMNKETFLNIVEDELRQNFIIYDCDIFIFIKERCFDGRKRFCAMRDWDRVNVVTMKSLGWR